MKIRNFSLLLLLITTVLVAACAPAAAPNATTGAATSGESAAAKPEVVRLDYAYYNPSSLVLRKFGWLEEELAKAQSRI